MKTSDWFCKSRWREIQAEMGREMVFDGSDDLVKWEKGKALKETESGRAPAL